MNHEYVSKLQRGCAFIPCYLKGKGKVTKVYFKEGGYEYVNHSVSKIINDYCAINLRNIVIIKRLCQTITGRKCITPLYIKEGVLFLPVKTIKPCTKGDKCIGYININFIEKIDFENSVVQLKNGQTLKYLDSKETIKKRVGDCTILHKSIVQ
ncbi:competence protein ComK [Clostridium sp. SYSU_GA19001]|uniref:competence protein ComK n=1 Tax=Clostridium caldaquaticum TaxID=2940653 RepID=UPI002077801F|nr:competence protein ComK [Clostridium caldaquaticum]MCM8709641.1 competence protein ComK [Clostridium caldaquaticum]